MGNLRVRKLSNKDADYLVQWLSNPLVLQYYAGRDNPHNIEMVREIFFKKIVKRRCIVEYGSKAIGYIQFYELDDEGKGEYGYTNLKEKICGTDQFIWRGVCRSTLSSPLWNLNIYIGFSLFCGELCVNFQ
jgi:aminoglycoside 6'-N-acetyltransferase